GIVEAWRYDGRDSYRMAATRLADGILSAVREDGFLPGRLRPDWTGAVDWTCNTGSVQIAHSLFLLAEGGGQDHYVEAGRSLNAWVRRTVRLDGPADVVGGVKGSHPIDNEYGRFQYLNWAAKFMIDSCQAELDLAEGRTLA
ncbi:MAG: hypothetical protein WA906_11000, partial [Pacificimonas sp.]